MSEFLTLSHESPEFRSYLDGSFSKTKRAVPIESLNVNTKSEQVTFQIFDLKDIKKPFWGTHWFQILKARNFLLAIFPIFLIYVKNQISQTLLDPTTTALSAVGALCLMIAANLRNDYQDHVSGLDRIHLFGGSRAIQNGWVTAQQMRNWSYVYLALGIAAGSRALIIYPNLWYMVGLVSLLGVFGLTSFSSGLKHRLWSEWMIFLMLGPLLTVGMQISTGAELDLQTLLLGVLTGWLAVFYLHLKNFEQLMIIDKAQFSNTILWLGFERSKAYLAFWGTTLVLTVILFQGLYSPTLWFSIWSFSLLPVLALYNRQLWKLKSPIGSGMKKAMVLGRMINLFTIALFVIQSLWHL